MMKKRNRPPKQQLAPVLTPAALASVVGGDPPTKIKETLVGD